MSHVIEMAESGDEAALRKIFLNAGMDLVGDIEDHIIIRRGNVIRGGGLLYQMDTDLYHLLTIAVLHSERSHGTGSQILQKILKQPWLCCNDAVEGGNSEYRVTTVSRGRSHRFYLKNGMVNCEFDSLISPFDRQCLVCPDVDDCHSAALIYRGTKASELVLLSGES